MEIYQETEPLMTDKDFWSSQMFTSLTQGYTSALLQMAILLLLRELSWQSEVSMIFSDSNVTVNKNICIVQ